MHCPPACWNHCEGARGALLTAGIAKPGCASASSEDIGQRALQNLLQPIGDGFSSWREDPLGLWGDWLRERAQWSRLRPRDGWLWIADGGIEWIALPFAEAAIGLFQLEQAGENSRRLAAARAAVAALGAEVRVVGAGAVLQAEAAAQRARWKLP